MIEIKADPALRRRLYIADGAKLVAIKTALPFAESIRGRYAHRVKHVSMYTSQKEKSHFIVKVWCGASFCVGGGGKGWIRLLKEPSNGNPICATCEGRYIGAGMDGERVINGKNVMYMPFSV